MSRSASIRSRTTRGTHQDCLVYFCSRQTLKAVHDGQMSLENEIGEDVLVVVGT